MQMLGRNQELFKMMMMQQNTVMNQSNSVQVAKLEEIYTQEELQQPGESIIKSTGKRRFSSRQMEHGSKKRFKSASELGLEL